MKTINFFLGALVIGSLLTTGCKKDEETDPTPTTPVDTTSNQQPYTSSMTANIDGVAFTATYISKMFQNGNVVISGSNTVKAIALTIDTTLNTGSFVMSSSDIDGWYSISLTSYYAQTGTGNCSITKFDKTNSIIEATFSFIGEDLMGSNPDVNITNGVLKVKYRS